MHVRERIYQVLFTWHFIDLYCLFVFQVNVQVAVAGYYTCQIVGYMYKMEYKIKCINP